MTAKEFRTIILAATGTMLEYYDFTVFVFLAPAISTVFFPSESPEWIRLLQTYSIFALGYLVRPVGGIVISHFGDRVGRKRMFMFSLLLMAIPTLCIGLLPTYAQAGWIAPSLLLALRLAQGFAIAGELPSAIVFVSEHASPRHVSFGCAMLLGIMFLGLALGAGTSGLLATFLPGPSDLNAWGWRLPFIAGGVFGLVSVFLRRFLQETPLFAALRETKRLSRTLPLAEVVRHHVAACVFVAGLALFLNQVSTVLFQYMPTLLVRQYGIAPQTVFWANTLAILAYAVMCPAWGLLADTIGRGRAMALGAALTAASTLWLFAGLPDVAQGKASLFQLWAAVGATAGFVGLITSSGASLFPTAVRLTGFSFPYNLATALGGGVTPVLLTWLVQVQGRWAPACLALFACFGFCTLGLLYPLMRRHLADGSRSAGLSGLVDGEAGS